MKTKLTFYVKEFQNTNQSEFRVQSLNFSKVITEKDDNLLIKKVHNLM